MLFDFVAQYRHKDTHQRANQVKEAIGEIDERRDAEDGSLRHTARIPRDQYRGHRHSVFRGAAQEPALVSILPVDFFKHVSCQDDGDVLVCRTYIQGNAGEDGGGYHAYAPLHEADEDGRERPQHAAGRHRAAKAHGADDEPDGIHHACHAAGGDERVEGFVARLDLRAAVEGHEQALEHRPGVRDVHPGYLAEQFGLEDNRADTGQECRCEERDNGRYPLRNQDARRDGDNH